MRIGVVAPSGRFTRAAAAQALEAAARIEPGVELVVHPRAFDEHGHFAGTDSDRLAAFLDCANDPAFDAIWFARGGHGACRIAEAAAAGLNRHGRDKAYLGYSDSGYLLAALYRAGAGEVAHGPVVNDLTRADGEIAFGRGLAWLARRDPAALEPHVESGTPRAAFNLTVLGLLAGTPLEPDLSGHVLMLEEVSEHLYRVDRALFHLTGQERMSRLAGIRLGRVSEVPDNDPPFGAAAEEIASFWCGRAGIPYLGPADIGHDVHNKVVPFGSG